MIGDSWGHARPRCEMTNTHTTCYDITHENDSQHDGKTFLDFLLALSLRANSIHTQLQALNLESHTPPS